VHAVIMAAQSLYDDRERRRLVGDAQALLLVAIVLGFLSSKPERASAI